MRNHKGTRNANYKHGLHHTKLHHVWSGMKQRCNNPNNISYPWYGGKGISYDPKWESFEGFFNDMGIEYKEGLTLDRIDGKKGYNKKNCRWITQQEQNNNTKRNRRITHLGETLTVSQWEIKLGFARGAISQRINTYGWSPLKSLVTPLRRKRGEIIECAFCSRKFPKVHKKHTFCSRRCVARQRISNQAFNEIVGKL